MKPGALAIALVFCVACGHEAPQPDQSAAAAAAGREHQGPHGGTLVNLGGEFAKVELVLDPDEGSLTAYVLDGEAEEPVRLRQPSLTVALDAPGSPAPQILELQAHADILTGETVGDSSEFISVNAALIHRSALKGRIQEITVKGQVFRGVQF